MTYREKIMNGLGVGPARSRREVPEELFRITDPEERPSEACEGRGSPTLPPYHLL